MKNKGSQPVQRSSQQQVDAGQPVTSVKHPLVNVAVRLVADGDYEAAFKILVQSGSAPEVVNARCVCLMHMEDFQRAVRSYRTLVLKPGCTWMKPELPTAYKANFAMALLLGGHMAGCLGVLAELREEGHPTVQRIRQSIKEWETKLTWWQRFQWRFGQIEPKVSPACIAELPDVFGADVLPQLTRSNENSADAVLVQQKSIVPMPPTTAA